MTQPSNKFESLLELLINEENDKAEQMFHEIVVEKSRDIYENLASTETKEESVEETKEEAKEESKEEVKETEATEEKVEETSEEKVEETSEESKDETVEETAEEKAEESATTEEESIEEVGGDATDDLIKDIASDEEGDAEGYEEEVDEEVAVLPQRTQGCGRGEGQVVGDHHQRGDPAPGIQRDKAPSGSLGNIGSDEGSLADHPSRRRVRLRHGRSAAASRTLRHHRSDHANHVVRSAGGPGRLRGRELGRGRRRPHQGRGDLAGHGPEQPGHRR